MPQSQSTTARQLFASLVWFAALQKQLNSPPAVAGRVTAARERVITELAQIIAAESHHLPNSKTWRDAFCADCDTNVCTLGTARDLAIKIYDLGWRQPSKRYSNLRCLECAEVA